MFNNSEPINMALIEWGSYDDYVKIKIPDNDKPVTNLVAIRSNQHVI